MRWLRVCASIIDHAADVVTLVAATVVAWCLWRLWLAYREDVHDD